MKKIVLLIIIAAAGIIYYLADTLAEEDETITIGVLLTVENRIVKLDGIRDGLEDLGYSMETVTFSVCEGEEEAERLEPYARELIDSDVDVIASFGGIETQVLAAVMEETGTKVPTVFVGMAAPVETGIIEEFMQPEGAFTGISNHHMHLSAKRMELFSDSVSELERVILLYSEDIDISRRALATAEEAAAKLGVTTEAFDAGSTLDVAALEELIEPGTGIMTLPSFQIEAMTEEIAGLSLRENVPVMGIYDYEVEAGFLMAYGSSFYDQGLQAARQISLILQGNAPGNIPVELPDQISFYVNETTKERLGVELDENIMKLTEPVRQNGGDEE